MSERRFGILIAGSRFPEEPKLTPLRCPENDVDALNEILTSKDRGEFTEILVFKNRPHYEVTRSINHVLRQATKDDLVLIYYSGHGKLNSANHLHLATVDTVLDELEATSIPVDIIREYVDISLSNKVVLILDCCFSGAAGAAFARGSVDDQLQLASRGRGTYIMTASTGIQVAQEREADQHGVFTKHIIEGIREGKADLDADGHITMEELYHYVHDKVLEENFQEPMKWDLNVRGQLIIARSGKIPWQERRRQIREILFDLAKKGMISDDILDKAREVSDLDPTKVSGVLHDYNDVLEELFQGRLEPVAFIRKWDKVGSKIVEPPPLPPPEPEPEPPLPKREPIEPRKKKNYFYLTAAAIAIIALIIYLGLVLVSLQKQNGGEETIPKQPTEGTGDILKSKEIKGVKSDATQLPREGRTVLISDAKSMILAYNLFHKDWNPNGTGIKHEYSRTNVGGYEIVVDKSTGLIWDDIHLKEQKYADAVDYIRQLNESKFAGKSTWRLPTLKEAMSLVSPKPYKDGVDFYIDQIFNTVGYFKIWTSNPRDQENVWVVRFDYAICDVFSTNGEHYASALAVTPMD
jgi:hypothetical protein